MSRSTPKDDDARGQPAGDTNTRVQAAIGRSLKAHYEDLIHAPIPDKFIELLARLELQEQKSRSKDDRDNGRG
jgi:Anti-sigma factor NepR